MGRSTAIIIWSTTIPSAGPPSLQSMPMLNEVVDRCNVIEECYEFMLAYAGQGIAGEEGGAGQGQIRDFLSRAAKALSGIADAYASALPEQGCAFASVLDRDAKDSLAAIELVLAQRAISSQLIDNLNASIHLRALLTDLFLMDEILKSQRSGGSQTGS
jgi:hypothetical protein